MCVGFLRSLHESSHHLLCLAQAFLAGVFPAPVVGLAAAAPLFSFQQVPIVVNSWMTLSTPAEQQQAQQEALQQQDFDKQVQQRKQQRCLDREALQAQKLQERTLSASQKHDPRQLQKQWQEQQMLKQQQYVIKEEQDPSGGVAAHPSNSVAGGVGLSGKNLQVRIPITHVGTYALSQGHSLPSAMPFPTPRLACCLSCCRLSPHM